MEEKRRFVRYLSRLEAAYALLIEAPDNERVEQTETVNLSRGGCTLVMSRSERPGTRLAVHLALPSGAEVTIQGRIAWIREPLAGMAGAMGVYFDESQPMPEGYVALLEDAERRGARSD